MWRFDSPHAEHGARLAAREPSGTSKPYVVAAGRLRAASSPRVVGEVAGVARPTCRSTRRCRDRRTGRRPRSRARAAGATARASPCRPTRPRAPARRAGSCRTRRSSCRTCSRQWRRKQSRQKAGVVAPDVDDRRLAAAPALHRAPPEITGRISTTSSSPRALRRGSTKRVVADHEHRLRDHVEVPQELLHGARGRKFELATRVAEHDFHRAPAYRREMSRPTYSGSASAEHEDVAGRDLGPEQHLGLAPRDAPDRSGTDREDREDHERAATRSGPGGCRSTSPGGAGP